MGRPSEDIKKIEAKRLEILHDHQAKARRRVNKETRVKKAGYHLPGEELHKKHMAIFLKLGIPGISHTEIANRIGETKTTVRKWFKEDPEVKEFYEFALSHIKEGAINYLETLGFEASETLAILMRYGSEKYMFEAASSILDRIGAAKVSKQHIEAENKKVHEWGDRDNLISEIRALPEDQQEEVIDALEKLEDLLAQQSASKKDGLKPIHDDDEEFEEEEADGEAS